MFWNLWDSQLEWELCSLFSNLSLVKTTAIELALDLSQDHKIS